MSGSAFVTIVGAVALGVLGCGARTDLDVSENAFDASLPDIDCLDDPTRCDDGSACTIDDCLPGGRCRNTPIRCEDGDACTDDACDDSSGCFTTPTRCDDSSLCTIDSCDSAIGCVRESIVCDDADPCTADGCDPRVGCTFVPTDCRGCADGTRDAFLDTARYERIAACAGGFAIAGLSRALAPMCDRGAGDDGPNPSGVGCTAADLCAPGWHVCVTAGEVASHSVDGCRGASDAPPASFFATRQTGPGCGHCSTGADRSCDNTSCRPGCAQTENTTNDIFGCGNLGAAPRAASCGVLDRFSNNLCGSLGPPWRCDDDPRGLRESDFVVKRGAAGGGVLCCLD